MIRNKFDRLKVRGFFLYLPTDWYHLMVGVSRDVRMTEGITRKYAMLLSTHPGAVERTFIRIRYSVEDKYLL